jgi:hypothetical protein
MGTLNPPTPPLINAAKEEFAINCHSGEGQNPAKIWDCNKVM